MSPVKNLLKPERTYEFGEFELPVIFELEEVPPMSVSATTNGQAELAARCRARFFAIGQNLDAIVTTDPVHIGYLGGYRSILHDMMRYRQALIATRDHLLLITGASDGAAALEVLGSPDRIWRYGTFFVEESPHVDGYGQMPDAKESFGEALASALRSLGLKGSRVGLDIADASDEAHIRDILDGCSFSDPSTVFLQSRMIKLEGELELLRKASRITDEAIALIHPLICAGVSELEISGEINRHIVRNGGIARFVVVTSGERSSRVDAYATDKPLAERELVRLDVGCTVDGYWSDMARTLVVGEPYEEQQARYDALLKGESAQLAMLKPGIRAADLYEEAMRTVRAGALPGYNRNHCGHGIGLRASEFPALANGQDVLLEPGMVFCVETPYYELGWGGMMVEDTAIVTNEGHELLTTSSRCLVPNLRAGN